MAVTLDLLCWLLKTNPAWTHLKLLKLQSVSNKPPRLLLSFNLFLTYPDARLPLMHSTYLNHCMINLILCILDTIHRLFFVTRLIINKINKVQWVDFKLENVLVSLHSLKTMGLGSIIFNVAMKAVTFSSPNKRSNAGVLSSLRPSSWLFITFYNLNFL
jgi:hypothetical protein